MSKVIYLIRHSAPFVEIDNYEDYKNVSWKEYNRNMILSSEGEERAKSLCELEDFKNLDEVYASDSFRAIGTAKYVAEMNNLKIKLDNRINERELGVEKICELPDNFSNDSFNNKNLKLGFGESLNEVDKRFESFIEEVLSSDKKNIALFIHGIILMSYLQEHSVFEFNNENLKILFKNEEVYNDRMKNPLIFKLKFDDNKQIIDIKCIECN